MEEVRNLDGKLVCEIRIDDRTIIIIRRDCVTMIHMKSDGSVEIENSRLKITAA